MVEKNRKLTTAIIVIVLLAVIGYVIYNQYVGQQPSVADFDEGLNLLDNAFVENSIGLYSSPAKEVIVSIPDSSFAKTTAKINSLKPSFKANALKDLATIYLNFVEEYILRKTLMVDADAFDALSQEEKCTSLDKADAVYKTQQELVNIYKSNTALITEFAGKYPTEYENTKLSEKLFSEDQLKDFTSQLYTMQTAVTEEKQKCE
ncbi:MAG: hypothetical protein AABW72_02770 [archaeon]